MLQPLKSNNPKGTELANPSTQIPAELDYFKYAQGGSSKRKPKDEIHQRTGKRRKIEAEDSEEDVDSAPAQEGPAISHRVSAKGKNVPPHADTFEAMKANGLPQWLIFNLVDFGYKHPSSVQAYVVPILLAVRVSVSTFVNDFF